MNSTDDPGIGNCASTCTLRDAIAAAAAGDVVNFDLSVFGTPQTITLTGGEIPITVPLFVAAPGADLLTVSGNHASRIFHVSAAGYVNINGLTISDGAAPDAGGAISSDGHGNLDMTNCVITRSSAAPGSGGGGVYVSGGNASFIGCTISNNSADVGGGVQIVNASAGFTNCTVSGNVATTSGGGVVLTADAAHSVLQSVNIADSTIGYNRAPAAGGLLVNSNGGVDTIGGIRNTIVAANDGGNLAKTGTGASLQSQGFNLISDGADALALAATDQINTDPRLAPLMRFGGTTPTHALLSGSPALDRGSTSSTADQRGATRPVDLGIVASPPGNAADIGAFEAQSDELLFVSGFETH